MRGRGHGNNRGFQKSSRGSGINPNAGRTSTRNWDRAPAAGPGTASTTTTASKTINQKAANTDDRSGLQFLPSVSRSSGLEPNGDALRSFRTQEEYWKYITEKANRFPVLEILDLELPNRVSSKNTADRQEKEANVMILLRKLREGFVSTKRRDEFAIRVVERSACLSLLYDSPKDIASSFGYLLDSYPSSPSPEKPISNPSQCTTKLLDLLHTLLNEYPSQRASHRLLSAQFPKDSPERSIASDISSALRRNNWWTLDKLTSPQFLRERLAHEPWAIPKPDQDQNTQEHQDQAEVFDALPRRALFHLVHELRVKVRNTAWPVLRSAYREVVDGPWLERALMLDQHQDADVSELSEFMRLGVEKGEAGVKDSSSGARVWILRRPA